MRYVFYFLCVVCLRIGNFLICILLFMNSHVLCGSVVCNHICSNFCSCYDLCCSLCIIMDFCIILLCCVTWYMLHVVDMMIHLCSLRCEPVRTCVVVNR